MKLPASCLLAVAALISPTVTALAAGAPLPGDRGRPLEGIPAPQTGADARRPPPGPGQPRAAAISMELALRAARAIDEACSAYPLGIAITDAAGVARLIYVPDRSEAWHGYSAVRKAYTAVTFKADTSVTAREAQRDPALAAQVRADPNLQAFPGGLVLKAGETVVGAIGVSGAEPGGHDEECALAGLNRIRDSLK